MGVRNIGAGDDQTTIYVHTQIKLRPSHSQLTHGEREEAEKEEQSHKNTRIYVVRRQAPSYVHGHSKALWNFRILTMMIVPR